MRQMVRLAVFLLLTVTCAPAFASGLDDKVPDQQSIDALQTQAKNAPPKEQCFLYAELVHQMTELSLRQYAQGNVEKSASLLRGIQKLLHNLHLSMGEDDKRLKNAQILLRHTAFRLTEMLHSSSIDDQPLVQQTLAQVNQAQMDAMMDVFKK